MNEASKSLSASHFEKLYATHADPWNFETSEYEAQKYTATLAALLCDRYSQALEIGCSIGVLTQQLAERCESLLAIDVSAQALTKAKQRCQDLPQVCFTQMHLPQEFPQDQFDLILLSEVGYYWSWEDLGLAAQQIIAHLCPGGHLLLVHWTPEVANYPLTGDQVHTLFLERRGTQLRHLEGRRETNYRLDLFERL